MYSAPAPSLTGAYGTQRHQQHTTFMPSADGLTADVMGDRLTALTGDLCVNVDEAAELMPPLTTE